jgi:dGTPase
LLVSGLIEGTAQSAAASGVKDYEDVRDFPARLAAYTSAAAQTSRQLKQFLYNKVYASAPLREDRLQSMAMIAELFQLFLDDSSRLPPLYAAQSQVEPPHRVICDYIAGMTDIFFRRTYEQLLSPSTLPRP